MTQQLMVGYRDAKILHEYLSRDQHYYDIRQHASMPADLLGNRLACCVGVETALLSSYSECWFARCSDVHCMILAFPDHVCKTLIRARNWPRFAT